MASVQRLTITEYEDNPSAVLTASANLGVHPAAITRLLHSANERLRRQFGTKRGPLIIRDETIRAENIAGLLRLSPSLELEIAPKFLGATWDAWRSDFFVIATLSLRGFILPSERLNAGLGDRGDLATLVARSLVEMFWELHRKPLRTYTHQHWSDVALDGDAEPEDLVRPSADGFNQSALRLTSSNPFCQAIHDAALVLVSEVRDSQTRGQLLRVASALSPQRSVGRRPRPQSVPTRHRAWQDLYDLSCQVLAGFGVNLDALSGSRSPGYVVRTPKAWEDLLLAATRLGLPGTRVTAQAEWTLGERNGVAFAVRPDLAIVHGDATSLADAKYKGRAGNGPTTAEASDVYESLAFMTAVGCNRLALLYPRPARLEDAAPQLGETVLTETIIVGDRAISTFEVELRGVAQRGGLKLLAERLGATLGSTLLAP